MSHWLRKHAGNLAYIAKMRGQDIALSVLQRQAFTQVHSQAHPIATGMNVTEGKVSEVVAAMCHACLASGPPDDCSGRRDWRDPCLLLDTCAER